MLDYCHCPVCNQASPAFDVVDFNKSCEEARGKFLPLSGKAIYYYKCTKCHFTFCPEIAQWDLAKFEEEIYNNQYIDIDPDYIESRPTNNANMLLNIFKKELSTFNHLDYGGGEGLLSHILQNNGWQTRSYDPFVDKTLSLNTLGQYDLITAFEVFEHVPNIEKLMQTLSTLLKNEGAVLFSTLLSNDHIKQGERLSWWYASPRNGHISLFSHESLCIIAEKYNFNFGSFSNNLHIFWKGSPTWAIHLLPQE